MTIAELMEKMHEIQRLQHLIAYEQVSDSTREQWQRELDALLSIEIQVREAREAAE